MKVIEARNVHIALPQAIQLLNRYGIPRETRNGPVLQAPWPVSTVYEKPIERVVFWTARDANPFFHLYESLWMLTGRNDVKPLIRYLPRFANYSDDGETLHGAYGYRWRHIAENEEGYSGLDQLRVIARMLEKNPNDRRAVLQMWDANEDLNTESKDIPCNDMATFQRDAEGRLHLVVFCRSNDIIWGCYGANAVHFSMLLEYMARWIGCPVGTYTQVSVNWHGYLDTLRKVDVLGRTPGFAAPMQYQNPYQFMNMESHVLTTEMTGEIDQIDELIHLLLEEADTGFTKLLGPDEPWAATFYYTLLAHQIYKADSPTEALKVLEDAPEQKADWIVAAREWLMRRKLKRDANALL